MNKYIIIVLSLFLTNITFSQDNKKSFEGSIKYKITFKFKEKFERKEYLKTKYGNEVIVTYDKSGSFNKKYTNSGKFGFDFVFYDSKSNNCFAKFNNMDTAYYYNVNEQNLELVQIKDGNYKKILGKKMKSLIVNAKDKSNGSLVKAIYYYSKKPYLNPSNYSEYNDFFYNQVIEKTKSVPLMQIIEFDNYLIIQEAIEIINEKTEVKIDNSIPSIKM